MASDCGFSHTAWIRIYAVVAGQMNTKNWLMLAALSLLWGGSFFLNELALPLGSSAVIVLGRVGVGALGLWALLWFKGLKMPRDRRLWACFAVMGLFNNLLPFILFVQAQRVLDSGMTATLNAVTPLFTALIAHALTTDEKLQTHTVVSLFIAATGVWMLTGSQSLAAGAGVAVCMPLAAAFCYGFAAVFARRLRQVAPEVSATGMLTCSSAMTLVLSVITGQWQQTVFAAVPVLAVLGLGLASTSLAYVLYFRLINNAGATALSLVTVLIPLSATALGVFFLGEKISQGMLLGMALIALSLAVFNGWIRSPVRA